MVGRLRLHGTALILGLVWSLGIVLPATAAETWTCWTATTTDGARQTVQITRCRLSGSAEFHDYASGESVPVDLEPSVGVSGSEVCWYWTTRESDWVMLGIDDSGVATLGIDPDGIDGGPVIVDAEYPPCTSEPADESDVAREAYELLARYRHPHPSGEVDPPPGAGVTGLATFVSDTPPPEWTASIVSPVTGLRIDVATRVVAVAVDWGDGSTVTVPETHFGRLVGWPDGGSSHVYQTKTCEPPGDGRCHPDLASYPLTISYVWAARYRVGGGAWRPLVVPPTSTTVAYDVDEILGLTSAVG